MIIPIIGMSDVIILTGINLLQIIPDFELMIGLYSNGLTPLRVNIAIVGSILGGILIMLTAASTLYLIFKKKASAIHSATTHYVCLVSIMAFELWADIILSDYFGSPRSPDALRDVITACFAGTLWISYFRLSRRVKNTFVN